MWRSLVNHFTGGSVRGEVPPARPSRAVCSLPHAFHSFTPRAFRAQAIQAAASTTRHPGFRVNIPFARTLISPTARRVHETAALFQALAPPPTLPRRSSSLFEPFYPISCCPLPTELPWKGEKGIAVHLTTR
jgi:hypothetical protein